MRQAVVLGLLWWALGASGLEAAPTSFDWGVAVLEVSSSRDARQEQLALRHCLELLGIPYHRTASVEEATRYPLVLVGGILFNTEVTPAEQEALYAYVERGGVLLATQVQGSNFFPLFGLEGATTSRTNFRVRFAPAADPALRYLNRPEERTVSLGDPAFYSETVWSTEYVPGRRTKVLAWYENGAVAFTVHPYGRGLAYALGIGFKETTLLPQLARSFQAARRWINSFEPSGDVFRLILRGLYEDNVHPFLLVHTVPEGYRTTLVLSHDIDARDSFRNSFLFARMEASLGVRSTFFVTTKYFRDATDIGYYTAGRIAWLRRVKELGFAVESHSVSHSLTFDEFAVGSAQVDPASYDPAHPTVFGEVLVSKQLLDHDLNQQTTGFRAGYLRYPSDLLRVLEATGYKYDSSVSAQWVLTNFPYFGFRQRRLGAEQSDIVVVPVTLDDSRDFLTPQTQERVLRLWGDIIEANAENGASTCLLIHPTDVTYKLETVRRLIEAHAHKDIWIGDVGSLARFWRHRARLRPTLRTGSGEAATIVLNLERQDIPPGQTLVVENLPKGPLPRVVDAAGVLLPVRTRVAGDRVFLFLPSP
ncbi:MAG: polysaccharide deacetylase family protein [Terriglobia bacterium]